MAYNKAKEEKKWRLWKEAEEKQLRSLGVSEDTIEKLHVHDWAIFNSDRRYYQRMQESGTYLEEVAEDTTPPEVKTVEDFLDSIENADSKYRAAPDFAVTHKENNGTPVQSQSERDKTVAGNEGGSVRTTVGVKLPWRQFAADRLATSRCVSGCRGQIEMLLSYQARYKAVYGNRALFYALPTLNTSLYLAAT